MNLLVPAILRPPDQNVENHFGQEEEIDGKLTLDPVIREESWISLPILIIVVPHKYGNQIQNVYLADYSFV